MAAPVVDPVPHADVHAALIVCGITDQNARNALIQFEGFDSLEMIGVMESDIDVDHMSKRAASRTQQAGRVYLTTVQIKNLQALVWWIHDQRKHGQALVAHNFTPQVLLDARERKRIEKDQTDTDISVKDLPKFAPDDFDDHEDAFLNFLAQTSGTQKVSLRYVVRAEEAPENFVSEDQRRMFQLPLVGASFEADNRNVYRKLKSFLVNTAGWAWIEPYDAAEDGRAAYWAWVNHYNGQGELSKRVQLAKAKLNGLHYKNESSMSFEFYQTLLTKALRTLSKSPDDRLSNRQQVETLMRGFKPSDPELIAAKSVVRQSYPADLVGACAYLGSMVAELHGTAVLESRKYRQKKRQISAMSGQSGGRGRGRGRGRFDRGRGRGGRNDGGRAGRGGRGRGSVTFNGIDVSDPMRSFTDDEWNALRPNGGLVWITQQRERFGGRGPIIRPPPANHPMRGQQQQRQAGAVEHEISGYNMQGSDTQSQQNDERGSRNGGRFGRGAYGQQGRGRGQNS